MSSTNGHAPELDEGEDVVDLFGAVVIALEETRAELRPLVERADALEELRRRCLAVASENPIDRAPVTGEALRAFALAAGEEDLARLENLLSRF